MTSVYRELCKVAEIHPVKAPVNLTEYTTIEAMANRSLDERLTAAMQVFVNIIIEENPDIKHVDKVLIDHFIAQIDKKLSAQLDAILHHETFQRYESLWRSLKYLVDNADFHANVKIEILDADKQTVGDDFEDVPDITQSGLYKHIYVQEYDTPGGEPISGIISNFTFDSSTKDIAILQSISKVAAAAHCPFLGSVEGKFFNKKSIEEVTRIDDLSSYMDRAEFIQWNSFRDSEDARYVGLTLPRFLLRLPYGQHNPIRSFVYEEETAGESIDKYLWGNATFAFAVNMVHSFQQHGWTVNIRGPEAGGKVKRLLLHQYDVGRGLQTKIPTEAIIPETRELEFAKLGFIPLSYYKNSDFACFFSANSVQRPQQYTSLQATANARINARLPYIFLSSRLGHYLKVVQRENIGLSKNRLELESELDHWLQTLVTKMNKPGPELAATHPLRDGKVIVEDIIDDPGFYKVTMYVVPHFQIEGVDVKLLLVSQLPKGEKK